MVVKKGELRAARLALILVGNLVDQLVVYWVA